MYRSVTERMKEGSFGGGDGEDGRRREVSHRGDGRKMFRSEREGL